LYHWAHGPGLSRGTGRAPHHRANGPSVDLPMAQRQRTSAMQPDSLHGTYGLTPVINAAGSYTPLGVSRSSDHVAQRVAQALQAFFVIDELQSLASARLSDFCGCEAAAVTHCVSAAITQAVAACIAGADTDAVAALPDAQGRA